jgi:hypothetical protein
MGTDKALIRLIRGGLRIVDAIVGFIAEERCGEKPLRGIGRGMRLMVSA